MLVSYNWLKYYVDPKLSPADLAEKLTRTGVEIAEVKEPMAGMKKLVVGEILTAEDVPDTHLHKTTVDVGEAEPLNIVCGAPNVEVGTKVIVALHGAKIAGGHKIKRGKIRGMESEGMLCGLQEIGFSESVVPKKYADGIFVYPEHSDVKVGDEVFESLGMTDHILDFDITPNRADTLSMEGAAYEVGAATGSEVKTEPVVLKEDGEKFDDLKIRCDEKLAPRFYMRKVTGVKVGESPLWMQTRLWNAGIRPINNVVDITNYVMLITGQPMHAYDAKVFNGQMEIRLAKAGEKLTLLNDQELELDPQDIVITDGQKPVMLAGVMGGKNSEVEDDTTDVYLEAAVFDSTLVRKAALRHANRTEASSRFEKGVNWDNVEKAINMAALLLRNEAGGTVLAGKIVASDTEKQVPVVKTTVSFINKSLGSDISADEMAKIFKQLNFEAAFSGDDIAVTIPLRRWDISIPADLVEEVGRIYGYDNLVSQTPVLPEVKGGFSEEETKRRRVKRFVQGQGLLEAISYTLTTEEKATLYTKEVKPVIKIAMPLNVAREALRQNLMTGLVDSASYNYARKETEWAIYEQGRVYDKQDGFQEHEHIAALYSGHVYATNWEHAEEKIDFYYVKGQLEELFASLGIKNVEYRPEAIPGMHKTRTAGIYIDGQYLGFVGMLDQLVLHKDKPLKGAELYGYELDLDLLGQFQVSGTESKPAPKFPAIERDLSILVSESTLNATVENIIAEHGGKYLNNVQVIDVYDGVGIPEGKKSLAYKLTFLNEHDTLTDDQVVKAMDEITSQLASQISAEIR
ncbi:MAG: phenylalanine--tRNA ligase subunit beta [Lactobacillus sp.]|nr:phenylalanine--tRNA ligase subunit beta [Lactobacillus sp.]